MAKITKKFVDAIKATGSDQTIWDDELPGFGVRIQESGRKTYLIRYRTKVGKQRKQNVGRCSDMHPEKARELARKMFAMVAEGKDPVAERAEERGSQQTVQDLRDKYQTEYAAKFKKPRSAQIDEINWRLHVLPRLGKRRVRDVDSADVMSMMGDLAHIPAVANQCFAMLSKAFNLAEMWKWRAPNTNPCKGGKKFEIDERELILSLPQIKTLNATLTDMVENNEIRKAMADLVRLLLLTGCRLREIMHAKREWVDRERSLLLLPDSKVGKRKIALSAPAMEIIDSISESETWLIPSRVKGQPINTPYKAWGLIKERAKLPKELRMHDLRHSAGSLGHMAGLSQKEIAIMLGHKQLKTTERYLHGHSGAESAIADKMSGVITAAW